MIGVHLRGSGVVVVNWMFTLVDLAVSLPACVVLVLTCLERRRYIAGIYACTRPAGPVSAVASTMSTDATSAADVAARLPAVQPSHHHHQ